MASDITVDHCSVCLSNVCLISFSFYLHIMFVALLFHFYFVNKNSLIMLMSITESLIRGYYKDYFEL